MRCLIVADLHYSLPQYDWLIHTAPRFDVVIIAGDHLDISSLVDIRAQSVVVRKYIALLGARTRLLTCSGNHDLDSRDPSGEKTARWIRDLAERGVPADGQSFACKDTLFTICPWWDGPLTRDRIAAQLAADQPKRTGRWFWVHHAPPDRSPTSWAGSRYAGDEPVLEWIGAFKPDIVFSGHVHQSPFTQGGSWVDRIGDTWVFNAGHQFGAPPTHVVVDTDENEAIWISAAGVQSVRLDRPLERPIPPRRSLPSWLTDPVGDPIPA